MDISPSDFIIKEEEKEKDISKEETTTIIKLLESLGITEYDNYTLNCLKQFINSYIKDLLKESKKRMLLLKRDKIVKEDLISLLYKKQYEMYKSHILEYENKSLERINMKELPPIPESPVVLKPPVTNNLLRNNLQIYSDELNEILKEKNNKIKEEEINMLGMKRNNKDINDTNNKHKKEQKNKRKKSVSLSVKQGLQESNKKEKEKDNKKTGNNISLSSNSLINNEESLGSDNSEFSKEIGDSTINKKEDEMNIDEDDDNENDNDNYEDEESDGNNDSNNNNDENESL